MGSGGGTLPVERAVREPVHTVLSGPAGGVTGALAWGREAGRERVLSFDMGGTSTDVSLCPGRPLHTREFEIDDQPVAVPVIDIHTVGAGGGSLARVDAGGALRVGPDSAGAVPGPICYGRGGTGVTVTDAHVWLGRIPADGFLGGDATLDREAIRGPLEALAGELGMTPDEVAAGVLEVADTAMERALRVISVERGFDPADFSLVAFGGAGALHAAELAGRLGVREALIPPNPGLLSAWGILTAPPTLEVSRTLMARVAGTGGSSEVEAALDEVEEEASRRLADEHALPSGAVGVTGWVDARYLGQSFELRVPREDWVEAFHEAHRTRFGYRRDAAEVEAVAVRAQATAPGIAARVPPLPAAAGEPPAIAGRTVSRGREVECPRIWRRDLRPGHRVAGPAVVLDYSATTWVPEGWVLDVHPAGLLRLTSGGLRG
jgi:N-methylhydantoinase A